MAPEPRANPILLGHDASGGHADRGTAGRAHAPRVADHRTRRRRQGDAGLPVRAPAAGWHAGGRHSGAGAHEPGVPPRRRRLACRPADRGARLRREAQAYAHADRGGRCAADQRLHEPHPGRGRLACRDRGRGRGTEPELGQRAAEGAGGAAAARGAAAGLRRARPIAAHDQEPLPAAAPRTARPGDDGAAAGELSARTCPRTNAAGW